MAGGGGGVTGEVNYPDYIKYIHRNMLDNDEWVEQVDELDVSVIAAINSSSSPFFGVVPYDRDADLTEIEDAVAVFLGQVIAMNYSTDFPAFNSLASAQTTYETSAVDTTSLENVDVDLDRDNDDIITFGQTLVDSVENRELPEFKISMQEIGAVQTSSFIIGESIIRAQKQRQYGQYAFAKRSELHKSGYQFDYETLSLYRTIEASHKDFYRLNERAFKLDRSSRLTYNVIEVIQRFSATFSYRQDFTLRLASSVNIRVISKIEEMEEDIDFAQYDSRYYLDSFYYGTNIIASIKGGAPVIAGRNKVVGAISGMISGAVTGASVGSIFPVIGTAIGAIVGAIAGGVLGYFA